LKKGKILGPEEIYACISYILDPVRNPTKEADQPLGVLTAENRDKWAELRSRLEQIGNNKESLAAIDSALYALALDDTDSHDIDKLSLQFLHGDPRNRWFDKNNTLIVNKNGHAAVNFEHSWGDGVAVLRFFNEIYDDSVKGQFVNAKTRPSFNRGDIQAYVKKLGNIKKYTKSYQFQTFFIYLLFLI
jgi:carnitine O-palmitoyltransferase 2